MVGLHFPTSSAFTEGYFLSSGPQCALEEREVKNSLMTALLAPIVAEAKHVGSLSLPYSGRSEVLRSVRLSERRSTSPVSRALASAD